MESTVYSGTRLKEEIKISELVTVHYFEFAKDYRFAGEQHDFWELVYVDMGEITAYSGDDEYKLTQGSLIFHKPNEWHTLIGNGICASSVAIISFKSHSEVLYNLCGKIFSTDIRQRTLLSKLINEASSAFDTPLSTLITPKLHRRKNAVFASEQMIKLYLLEFLISFLRDEYIHSSASLNGHTGNTLFDTIVNFMEENLDKKLTLSDIAQYAAISKTALKKLFREQAGCGACEYFTRMKINRAKIYIREENYNFTQIAEMLGYDSIHYFSRTFKQYVNMPPSEYAASIRAFTKNAVTPFSENY